MIHLRDWGKIWIKSLRPTILLGLGDIIPDFTIRVFPKERLRLSLFAPWPGSGVVIAHLFP